MRFAKVIFAAAVVLSGSGLWAQTAPPEATPPAKTAAPETAAVRPPRVDVNTFPVQTFYLKNVSAPNDANEIQTAVRNLLSPEAKIYLVPSQNAIFVRASPEQIAVAQKVIADMDLPKKLFRLTYTISEMDGGKKVSTQSFSMMAVDGQRVTLKQGSKIPIATGSYSSGNAAAQTQFQYLDVGMNFDTMPVAVANGAILKTKVEQSSVAQQSAVIADVKEPVIRQATLESTSRVTLGKALMLGSLDIPRSTAHLDVEVTIELVP